MTRNADISLTNQDILRKVDKLRETNVGAIIPLPQLVVVGDQSSGKSSVLESLTGFSFPRAAGLCTRYATQITCIRDAREHISVSIIPHADADKTVKERLSAFHKGLDEMNEENLARIFEEANAAMGIRMIDDESLDLSAFSLDMLKIEISGPEQLHLTVIDVPGIFRVATPGLTSESDVVLVRNLVKRYMQDRRTIILAVIPCNVDIATQEILKLAEEADPEGIRTMGVLTKPDLASEMTMQDAVISLVKGKRNSLKLGYCVVKNRSADDDTSTQTERHAAEQAFFTASPWSSVADRCGILGLKIRLSDLLLEISKREMPKVKSDIEQRVRECKKCLDGMGEPRADERSQRQYLAKIASQMQDITKSALNGYYAGEDLFVQKPELKLITRMLHLNEEFSNMFWKRGHYQHFGTSWSDDGEHALGEKNEALPFEIQLDAYSELQDIVAPDFDCPKPLKGPMTSQIQAVYESSRGPELGTFNGTVLAAVFTEASQKWEQLVLSHTSRAVVIVHGFLFELLTATCADSTIKSRLWGCLVEDLRKQYSRAMDHARFLVDIERGSRPATYNHYFNSTLQKKRQDRLVKLFENMLPVDPFGDKEKTIHVDQLGNYAANMSNNQQVCEDILDTLESYYKVARKRIVDTVCQQVINHLLLEGPESPLRVMCTAWVLDLAPEELEMIAGEDTASKRQRDILTRELDSLNKAIMVLRA